VALAAELNGYPGPIHAFELADGLEFAAQETPARLSQLTQKSVNGYVSFARST
jgi:hypothetical protein